MADGAEEVRKRRGVTRSSNSRQLTLFSSMYELKPYDGGILAGGIEGEEWMLQSPIHVAAYQGDVASLEELLTTGKSFESFVGRVYVVLIMS